MNPRLAERPRATRYELSAPMVYRGLGDDAWHDGRTENISRSGVLFQAAAPGLPDSTRVEFAVKLPGLKSLEGSWVRCRGQIARHGSVSSEGGCEMAVTIEDYTFLGGGPAGVPDVGKS